MPSVLAALADCRVCPAVRPGPILPAAPGDRPPPILLVGEAPGRLGAGRTGVPFEGDEAGRRLDAFLAEADLRRGMLYITNAVLCLPIGVRGNNRTPAGHEIRRCSPNLAAQIDLVRPRVVVTLGGVALAATHLIMPHDLVLARVAGQPTRWRGAWLVPMFHPARRSTIHRGEEAQRDDWRRLGQWLREARLVPDSAAR